MKISDLVRSLIGHSSPASSDAPPRLLQIGVDFGTCWSKLVIRDYESPRPFAFVVRPAGADKGPNREYRIPSAVTSHGGRLFFGWPGDRRSAKDDATTWTSVKMRAAFPEAEPYRSMAPMPDGLAAEDLATLVVAYLLQVAAGTAAAYAAHLKPSHTARPGVSVGVPMNMVQDERLRDQFVRIARTAFDLVNHSPPNLSSGLEPATAVALLRDARSRLALKPDVQRPRDWVRSEAEAGLLWIVQSPRVPAGKYACVDIGAGTTDVSVFKIVDTHHEDRWLKDRLLFYSANSSRPGVDCIDDVICTASNIAKRAVRGSEEELIRDLDAGAIARIEKIAGAMHEVYRQAWAEAFKKRKTVSEWEGMGLFVLGGGSKLSTLSQEMSRSPWFGQIRDRRALPNEYPFDLYEAPSGRSAPKPFDGDPTFLLVAYGLSYMGDDVPPVDAPDDSADFNLPLRPRRPVDQDEYYPK